jgi:hypothetical protein
VVVRTLRRDNNMGSSIAGISSDAFAGGGHFDSLQTPCNGGLPTVSALQQHDFSSGVILGQRHRDYGFGARSGRFRYRRYALQSKLASALSSRLLFFLLIPVTGTLGRRKEPKWRNINDIQMAFSGTDLGRSCHEHMGPGDGLQQG